MPGSTHPALKGTGRIIMGAYLVALPLLLAYFVYELWPTQEVSEATGKVPDSELSLFGGLIEFRLNAEVRLILLVMAVGALGSYVHTATSFADYVGNRQLYASWAWWYILRPFIGLSLALIFYFIVRAGMFSTEAGAGDISPYGVAAIAGIVGMFSKQAADKLRELFASLFPTKGDELRADSLRPDKLIGLTPTITSIDPSTVPAGSTDVDITLDGTHFANDSSIRLNGEERPTTYVSDTQLKARILASDWASAGEAQVTVLNPEPGGGMSNAVTLRIE